MNLDTLHSRKIYTQLAPEAGGHTVRTGRLPSSLYSNPSHLAFFSIGEPHYWRYFGYGPKFSNIGEFPPNWRSLPQCTARVTSEGRSWRQNQFPRIIVCRSLCYCELFFAFLTSDLWRFLTIMATPKCTRRCRGSSWQRKLNFQWFKWVLRAQKGEFGDWQRLIGAIYM